MSDHLPTVEIEVGVQPEYAVIWMHGLGADGHDFAPIVSQLGLPPQLGVRFVFPHAPSIPVTWNNGYVMPAWYDITELDRSVGFTDVAGLQRSSLAIRQLIARENARGIPSEQIVLAGFSQGGAMAYTVGLTHAQRLAGVLALSTYIPSWEVIATNLSEENRSIPIFIAHGTDDPVLPLSIGVHARSLLQQERYSVLWRTYSMAHTVCTEEITDISIWLSQIFSKQVTKQT